MDTRSTSQEIDDIITLYGGWKADILSQIRAAVKQADPSIIEEVKWKMRSRPEGLPVWSHDGIVCITETFKNDIKLVFFKGALLNGMEKHFNARLKSKTDRAIEFHDGDIVDVAVLHKLVVEAVKVNIARQSTR